MNEVKENLWAKGVSSILKCKWYHFKMAYSLHFGLSEVLLINTKCFYLKKYRIRVHYENPVQFFRNLRVVSFVPSVFMVKPVFPCYFINGVVNRKIEESYLVSHSLLWPKQSFSAFRVLQRMGIECL